MAPKRKVKGGEKGSATMTPPSARSSQRSPEPPAPNSSSSSLQTEAEQMELEFELQNALVTYPHWRLSGMHRHFIVFGLMDYLERRMNRHFTSDEVLQLLDRSYNLDHLTLDRLEVELLNQQREFSLPRDIFLPTDND